MFVQKALLPLTAARVRRIEGVEGTNVSAASRSLQVLFQIQKQRQTVVEMLLRLTIAELLAVNFPLVVKPILLQPGLIPMTGKRHRP